MKSILAFCTLRFWLMSAAELSLFNISSAQTFNGTGGGIPDDGTSISFPIVVSGLPAVIDTNFGVETVCIDLVHTWDDDLTIRLISPDGTTIDLASHNGGGDDNYTNTCFNDTASQSINQVWAPFTGTFRPEMNMGGVNNGQNGNGTWQLFFIDTWAFADVGTLFSWSITFGNTPGKPFPFDHSQLPIVVIKTHGAAIVNEPMAHVEMGLIDNGPGNLNYLTDPWNGYDGWAGIDIRGNSSQGFPKLSYSLETEDSIGNNLDTNLLDMPKENDWVLIANYSDKSLMRNFLAYNLFDDMQPWGPRMRYVDLVIDGIYRGVYLLGEKVKRDNDRVNVSKLDIDDNAGDSLTGGYIWKVDWGQGGGIGGWNSQYNAINNTNGPLFYQYHYPKPELITGPQMTYLAAFVDSFEDVCATFNFDTLNGVQKYVDYGSFADDFIVSELAKNVDAYWLSSFFYKDKQSEGGKVHAGPIWDYDLAFCNADYNGGFYPGGWHIQEYADQFDVLPMVWYVVWQDTNFHNVLKCRWNELRETVLDQNRIYGIIDSVAALIDSSQMKNFDLWEILGVYVWPNPQPIPATYAGEVQKLKDWLAFRLGWMDANMPGNCPEPPPAGVREEELRNQISIYPDPFVDEINVEWKPQDSGQLIVELIDNTGKLIKTLSDESFSAGNYSKKFFVGNDISSGIYFMNFKVNGESHFRKVVKQ